MVHDKENCTCAGCVEYREEIKHQEKHDEMLYEYEKEIEENSENE